MILPSRIVDSHQHFWDTRLARNPWLCENQQVYFRYGDYDSIRKPYLPNDYYSDAAPIDIVASVYVETEWCQDDPIGEMDWVTKIKAHFGLPTVAVAQAWLDRKNLEETLESHCSRGFVRSVRHKPRSNSAPGGEPGAMADLVWREGFALLAPLGLSFDLQTPWWHLCEARTLADKFPSTQIILNHSGLPSDRSHDGLNKWYIAMKDLSGAPNVSVKLSGLGQQKKSWTIESNRNIILRTIDLFGVDRCMFGSNFPVDSLCGGFTEIFSGFFQIVADFSNQERDALFVQNAMRIYNI